MADAARLNANADMAGLWIQQRLLCQFELARADHMYRAIRRSGLRHRNLYLCETWSIWHGLCRINACTGVLNCATADLLSQKSCFSSHGYEAPLASAMLLGSNHAMRLYVLMCYKLRGGWQAIPAFSEAV
jgi:hypothetical protein